MQINKMPVSQMRQPQAFEFHNRVYNQLTTIRFDDLTPYVEKFDIAIAEFDKALKPLRKSLLTEKIIQVDESRDAAWYGLKAMVQLLLTSPDENMREKAKKFDRVINTYGNPTRLPYTEETGVIHNLVTDLEKELSLADRTLLGVEIWLNELDGANREFRKLVKERNNEQATLISGESKAKRILADDAYKTVVKMVNAYALTADNPLVFREAIRNINQIIDKENAVIKARRTRSSKKGDTTEQSSPGDNIE